jgi:glycine oxidase
MHDAIIVGGGAVGLSTARELALAGLSVLVLDRGNPQDAASWAAAGMIAPQSEADEPNPFFELCRSSARLYPEWTAQLQSESGVDPEFIRSGVLFVASSDQSLGALHCMVDWQTKAGLRAELLTPDAAQRMEPSLTLSLTGAAWLPDEAQVTPRKLLACLRRACSERGVEIRNGEEAVEIEREQRRAVAVRTSRDRIPAGHIVITSGVSSASLRGVSPAIPVSPRKGQILSLSVKAPVFRRMVRWDAYVVPRPGGELVVGATNEDAGYDRALTPAGIGGLLQNAQRLAASLSSAGIREMWTGLRPSSPDGFPVIGKADLEGLIYATAHYRNGILLAPLTAACVAALVTGRPSPVGLETCSPSRFRQQTV